MPKRLKTKGLVAHLRSYGLKVIEEPGWRTRGRPYDFKPRAIFVHHTASSKNGGASPSLGIVRDGRPGITGPLSQFVLGRDAKVRVVAAGYANHAGYGGPKAGIAANTGNTFAIGIEAENDGIGEKWSKEQVNAYYQLCAALLDWIDVKDSSKVIGHKEWAPNRKIDPNGINMTKFRKNVDKALKAGPKVKTVSLKKVKPGKRNADVILVKKALRKKGFNKADINSNFFGARTKADYRAWQASLGFKGADADGVPGKTSLKKLGFKVVN